MVKFGRKFFFDKVYTKKNYTLPIIIGVVLIVAIIATFLVTRYFKTNDKNEKVIKVVFNDTLNIELYSVLPTSKDFIKEIKNIEYSDLEIIYPKELETVVDTSACENEENMEACTKILVSSLGEFKITIKSDRLEKKENVVTLNVIDSIKPELALKEVNITEGKAYKIEDFIESCYDNSDSPCTYEFVKDNKDEEGNIIDYGKFTTVGEHIIKIIAKDTSGNVSEVKETKLIINKKKNQTTETKTCKYGNLKYSNSYVVATKIENTECAISVAEAESVSNKAALKHNQKLVKEIQTAYLKNTIGAMNLEGQITYDITYGLVYNTTKKGVVGYYLMSEARQTVGDTTTTIARYFIDENGNRVWKVDTLNLK